MHARSNARHDNDSTTAGTDRDEAGSMKSENVGGNDGHARRTPASDAMAGGMQAMSNIGADLSSSAPTMRSRVTVVCAECKKQKLKCDRRMPCESCTKRNTVSRCIYTPAAIEKVDVTSINNRLRVVEGSLNALGVPTSGFPQQPLAPLQLQVNPQLFMQQLQNSFGMLPAMRGMGAPSAGTRTSPFAINPKIQENAHLSGGTHDSGLSMHVSRILALSCDARGASAISPLDGAALLWVRELAAEPGHGYSSRLQSNRDSRDPMRFPPTAGENLVSNKTMKLDLQPIDREATSASATFGFGRDGSIDAKQRLALHAGLGLASSPRGVLGGQTAEMESESMSSVSEDVTNSALDLYTPLALELLSQFPTRHARQNMLSRLGAANLTEGMSCVPFPAFRASVEEVCSFVSARSPSDNIRLPAPAFSKIAESAVGLAVGALLWALEPSAAGATSNEGFESQATMAESARIPSVTSSFADLSRSSSVNEVGSSRNEEAERPSVTAAYALYRLAHLALAMHTARHGHAARDPAYMHTYTLSAHYLLLAHTTGPDLPDAILPPELPPLIGSLVWQARAMGLGVDPDEFDPPDEMQTRAGWPPTETEAGGGGHVKREEGAGTSKGKRMSLFTKEIRRRLWWSVVWLDLLVSDTLGYNTTILPGEYTTRLPANVDDSSFHSGSDSLPPPDDSSPERNNTFYVIKLRLLEIGKHAPLRAFRSGLIPNMEDSDSATTAAAQRLADEIEQWLDDLPDRFKLDASDENLPSGRSSPPPMTSLISPTAVRSSSDQNPAQAMLIAQRCDLAFHSFHTIMRLFTPKLSTPVSSTTQQPTSASRHGMKLMSPDRQFLGLRAVEPALALVRAAQVHMTYATCAPRGTYHMYIFARRLFEAAVVLAYVAIQQPLYTSPIVLEAVRTTLDILPQVLRRNGGQGDDTDTGGKTEAEFIVETLLNRAEKARTLSAPVTAGVKRKHDDVDSDTSEFESPFRFPFLGSGIINAFSTPAEGTSSSRNHGANISSAHPRPPPYPYSNPSIPKDDTRSQASSSVSTSHRGDPPVVSIRQRLRDRQVRTNNVDGARTRPSTPFNQDFRGPPPHNIPPYPFHSRVSYPGPSALPPDSRFSSESASASPVTPLQAYNPDVGARPVNIIPNPSFLEVESMIPGPPPFSNVALQGSAPYSSTPYQYPVPAPGLAGTSYSSQQPYETSMNGSSPISASGLSHQHGVNTMYPSPLNRFTAGGDGLNIATGSSPAFLNRGQGPQSNSTYPHGPNQNQPTPWNGDENSSSTPFPPSWDTSSFMNQMHDV